MKGDTLIKPDPQSVKQKFNYWFANGTKNTLNYQEITVAATNTIWESRFKKTNDATIQALLIDGGGAGTTGAPGIVQFADPWLIDYADDKGKMNRGTTYPLVFRTPDIGTNNIGTGNNWYKGVFLMEGGPTGKWNQPPYYQVSAPTTATILGYPAKFYQWGGTNVEYQSNAQTTGVKFTASGATVTAWYKGHLASSTAQAVGGNNQARRIAGDNAVYTSVNNTLWTTHWNGSGWEQERLLGEPYINACINGIKMVTETAPVDGDRFIDLWESTNGGVTWNNTGYWFVTFEYLPELKPVIHTGFIVWRQSDGLHSPQYQQALAPLPETDATSEPPSLSSDMYSRYYLAYKEGNKIQFQEYSLSGSTINQAAPEYTLSSIGANPSIAYSNNVVKRLGVVWEWSGTIYFKERYPNAQGALVWGNIETLPGHMGHTRSKPQVAYDYASQKVIVTFQCGSHIGMVTKNIGTTTWSGVVYLGEGTGPALTQDYQSPKRIMWTTGTAAPYRINVFTFNPTNYAGGNINSPTQWSGVMNVTGNVIVNSTLTVLPGTIILFQNGSKMIVNGSLVANGTSTNRITFDFMSRNATTQNGLWLQGSSASLRHCDIKNAYNGVRREYAFYAATIENCNITENTFGIMATGDGGMLTPGNYIRNNYIYGNYSNGIYLSYYSPDNIHDNTISNNARHGIYCIGTAPYVYNNKFLSNGGDGIRGENYSPIKLRTPSGGYGNNLISGNWGDPNYGAGLSAYYSSHIEAGHNSTMQGRNSIKNNEFHTATAASNSHVMAEYNWWNNPTSPNFPLPGTLLTTGGGTIDYDPAINWDPYPGMGKVSTPQEQQSPVVEPMPFFDKELKDALNDLRERMPEQAIAKYMQRLKKETDKEKKRYVLTQIAESYRAANAKTLVEGKSSGKYSSKVFTQFLETEIRKNLSNNDDLYATTLELENLFLLAEQDYANAIENWNELKSLFAWNRETYKYALFNLGQLYYNRLNDTAKAMENFVELKTKYPDDDVAITVRLQLGEIDEAPRRDTARMRKDYASNLQPPQEYALMQNYPNPFNPVTTINYQIPKDGMVTVKIYDLLGREVKTLVNEHKTIGRYSVTFDASSLASGMYVYRMVSQPTDGGRNDVFTAVKKLLFLK